MPRKASGDARHEAVVASAGTWGTPAKQDTGGLGHLRLCSQAEVAVSGACSAGLGEPVPAAVEAGAVPGSGHTPLRGEALTYVSLGGPGARRVAALVRSRAKRATAQP